MTLRTGNQLKAARALIDMKQGELAKLAGVNINTVVFMERSGSSDITSAADKVQAVQSALEEAGIEFLNHGQPGVRLAAKA
ncbi:helix-turn-helix transcriptional regulator [Agrobacterium fabrum]|uniref:helix-turn-helix transcriptional regulator n=1 Tax=Agrobacterium fabrum TaxID=1176649 RepID=UPI001571DA6D|nr:hypothetical protein [Agrobacterium fabrum]NTB08236.1 hypothetical protein [Agrobacterium fabrum]